jgi:HD-GYP domain-containing protein (c-di-GMP phosphodiesterase class II)
LNQARVVLKHPLDAMISYRPYRRAMPFSRALAECAGTQFDAAVVKAFLAAWAEGNSAEIRAA